MLSLEPGGEWLKRIGRTPLIWMSTLTTLIGVLGGYGEFERQFGPVHLDRDTGLQ
jgi:hypothetical protein